MIHGKQKCDKCKGKGYYVRQSLRINMRLDCTQCAGRGAWWVNKKPKAAKVKR